MVYTTPPTQAGAVVRLLPIQPTHHTICTDQLVNDHPCSQLRGY